MEANKRPPTLSTQTQYRTAGEGEPKYIEGYFAVFNSNYELWEGATESVDEHAFDNALADDIRALNDHETHLLLGRNKAGTLELKVDARGLWGRIEINGDDRSALDLYAQVKRGDKSQCSFGFDIIREEVRVNSDGSVHWTLKEVKLYEVSVVSFPAYDATSVTARKMDHDHINARKKDFEQIRNRQHQAWQEILKVRIKHGTQTTRTS
jgi:hypothetical protein